MVKIIKNKIFLLVILILSFLAFSYLEGGSFFKEKISDKNDTKEKKSLIEEKLVDDSSNKEFIEEIEPSVKIEIESPTQIPPTLAPVFGDVIDDLIYPGGEVLDKSSNGLTIESDNDPIEITNWYKKKIKGFEMNAISVVQTNTNGNILNKMSASNGKFTIEVEISRSNSSNMAKIVAKLL